MCWFIRRFISHTFLIWYSRNQRFITESLNWRFLKVVLDVADVLITHKRLVLLLTVSFSHVYLRQIFIKLTVIYPIRYNFCVMLYSLYLMLYVLFSMLIELVDLVLDWVQSACKVTQKNGNVFDPLVEVLDQLILFSEVMIIDFATAHIRHHLHTSLVR